MPSRVQRARLVLLATTVLFAACSNDDSEGIPESTAAAAPTGSVIDTTAPASGSTAAATDSIENGNEPDPEATEAASTSGPELPSGPDGVDRDLSEVLLKTSDLPGTWESEGPEPLSGFAPGGTLGPICSAGESVTLDEPERTVAAPENAYITFTLADNVDTYITEALIHDERDSVFDALTAVFDSCVGEPFEQGSDPIETVQYGRLDVAGLSDDSVGFVERWGTRGALDGGEVGHVIAGTGEVVVVVSLGREDVTDPYDQDLLSEVAAAALAKVARTPTPPAATPPPTSPTTPPPTSPPPPVPASVDFFDLAVGQCLLGEDLIGGGFTDWTFDVIDCASPHHGEVFHVSELPDPPGAPYPGDRMAADLASTVCVPGFEQYVGRPYTESRLGFVYITPDADSWPTGDRRITCYLHDRGGAELMGSAAGTDQ